MPSVAKLALMALVGAVLMTATGCVPKEEYDKAVAASRRAHEELQKAQAALLELRQENERLKAELAQRQAELAAKDKIIASLQAENKQLRDELAKLRDLLGKGGTPAPMPMALPASMNDALRNLAANSNGLLTFDERNGMVKFNADMTFAPGSTELKPQAKEALKKLAEIMNTADAMPFSMYVAGHTDDIPLKSPETVRLHGSNWGLSAHRSLAVVMALAEDNIDQVRMGAMGFSKYHPVAANAPGNKGNQANRRVEVWIVPQDRLFTTDGATVTPEAAPSEAAPAKEEKKAVKAPKADVKVAPEAPAEE